MTSPREVNLKCAVCGQVNKYWVLASMSCFEPPDLDTRPGRPGRDAFYLAINRCPNCGYASPWLEEAPPMTSEIVHSEEYQSLVNRPGFPETANSYLGWSYIMEKTGRIVEAGWASLKAAWACDDEEKVEDGDESTKRAKQCRLRAIEMFELARKKKQRFCRRKGDEIALLTDLYRRTGQFNKAGDLCKLGLRRNIKPHVKEILKYEMKLIDRKDDKLHKVYEMENFQSFWD